jgi:hypothetical protein
MKLVKLSVFMAVFVSFTQVAVAVGPVRSVADYRAGTFLCLGDGSGPKSGTIVAAAKADDRREPANTSSAQ